MVGGVIAGAGIRANIAGVTVTGSVITGNEVGISRDGDDFRIVAHRNVIANNEEGGVVATGAPTDAVNVTHNYWGASDGPSSYPANDSDAPFEDPETGALANGSGDGISEATDDDLSGIAAGRFDSWLAVPALNDAFAGPPQDLDGDGLYEDVNGDGAVNVGDAQALFAFEDSAIVQENAALFDFNEDGDVDVGDAQALFAQVTN